jgi:hypothetical protein
MTIKVAHSRPPKLNLDLILLLILSHPLQWNTTSRPLPLCAVARTRFRNHPSIIHPPRTPETPSASHTPPVFHEAPPTMLRRLYLGGEVAATAGPVTVILTTALPTTTVATDAPIASAPTDNTTAVPMSMYASLFPSLTASADSILNFSTPHNAPTRV